MGTKYVVTSQRLPGIFGIFDEYETAQRAAGAWSEDYGVAFAINDEEFTPNDKPESWLDHILRRLRGGKG